jgi:hypothetical protein
MHSPAGRRLPRLPDNDPRFPLASATQLCGIGCLLFLSAAHARAGAALRWETVHVRRIVAVLPPAAFAGLLAAIHVAQAGPAGAAQALGLGRLTAAFLVISLFSLAATGALVMWALTRQPARRSGSRPMFSSGWWIGYLAFTIGTAAALLAVDLEIMG